MNLAGFQGEGAQHRRRCGGCFIVAAVYSTSNGRNIDRSGCCIPFFRYAMKHVVSVLIRQSVNQSIN